MVNTGRDLRWPQPERSDAFKGRFSEWPVSGQGRSSSPLERSLKRCDGWSDFKGKQDSSSYSAATFLSALPNAKLIFIEVQLFGFKCGGFFLNFYFASEIQLDLTTSKTKYILYPVKKKDLQFPVNQSDNYPNK